MFNEVRKLFDFSRRFRVGGNTLQIRPPVWNLREQSGQLVWRVWSLRLGVVRRLIS